MQVKLDTVRKCDLYTNTVRMPLKQKTISLGFPNTTERERELRLQHLGEYYWWTLIWGVWIAHKTLSHLCLIMFSIKTKTDCIGEKYYFDMHQRYLISHNTCMINIKDITVTVPSLIKITNCCCCNHNIQAIRFEKISLCHLYPETKVRVKVCVQSVQVYKPFSKSVMSMNSLYFEILKPLCHLFTKIALTCRFVWLNSSTFNGNSQLLCSEKSRLHWSNIKKDSFKQLVTLLTSVLLAVPKCHPHSFVL